MSNTPQGAESPVEIVDRRLCVRRPVPSLAYVDLGENNGGIILNIGEGGLAVTSVAPLHADVLSRMRFQLPGSGDWLEAAGEIARISESEKEAGLRFVDLSEDARNRIKNWVSSAESPDQSETSKILVEKEQPVGPPPTPAVKSATAKFAGAAKVAHPEVQGSRPAAGTDTRSPGEEGVVASRVPREEQIAPDSLAQSRDPLRHSDRRAHVRRPIASLAYVDLGENNGGIILNIGEGGLAVASAAPLYTDGLARMRFQLPGSGDWLEASGKIARISESKKEAGLRFVELSEDARDQIKGWISSGVSPVEFQPEGGAARERAWRRLEMPIMAMPQSMPPQPANPDRVAQGHAQVSMPTPNAAPTLVSTKTWVAASAPTDRSPRSWEGFGHRLGVESGDGPKRFLLRWRTWAALAVVLFLGAFLAGWFTAGPSSMSRLLALIGKTRSETSETANGVEPPPASSVASVTGQASDTPTEARSNEVAPASKGANVVSSSARVAHSQEHFLEPRPANAAANAISPPAANAPPQGVGSVALPTQETSVTTPPSPNVNQPEGARTTGTAEPGSSPAPKPVENPEVSKGSVSVSFGLFPSIRVPAGLKSNQSLHGAALQIGQLLSRVDPVYPQDAETQQIEGIVKLHAIIGPDGTIESVEQRSGPALLMSAAANAVRQWRYTPSSVGGQPVGAEDDITITFRLRGQGARPN
jgi:TonB family protein